MLSAESAISFPMTRPSLPFLLPITGLLFTWFRLNHQITSSLSLDFAIKKSTTTIPWPGYEPVKPYSPSKHTNVTVAICLIVRNETVYMDEWADFHIALGFAPIFIYDNADVPDLELQAWYDRRKDIQRYIHIRHMPLFPVQGHAYEQCLRHDAANDTFAAMIDVDEFVVLKKHDNASLILWYSTAIANVDKSLSIGIPWEHPTELNILRYP